MKPKVPEILSTNVIAKSRLFTIEEIQLKFSNQAERTYERMQGNRGGAVMIVPVLNDETLLLCREYAAGTERYELGFPKGLVDPGEEPIAAANRELQEELGYGAKKLTHLMHVSLASGYFASKMEIYLAQDLYPSQLEGDEPEPIELVPWPTKNWSELLSQDDFTEARSISALFLAQKYLKL